MEDLVQIPGYSRYFATKDGHIYNYNKQIKPVMHNGYELVSLMSDTLKRQRKERVHRLIATTFIGAAPSPKHQVNHKDGNKLNNKASNLEWVSPSENMQHFYTTHGQLHNSPLMFEEPDGKVHIYKSMLRASQELGVALSTIWSATFEGTYKGCKLYRL